MHIGDMLSRSVFHRRRFESILIFHDTKLKEANREGKNLSPILCWLHYASALEIVCKGSELCVRMLVVRIKVLVRCTMNSNRPFINHIFR